MTDLEPDHNKREVRAFTAVFTLLGASAVVCSVWPAAEAFLNLWVLVGVGVAAGVAGVVLVVKRAWGWWSL